MEYKVLKILENREVAIKFQFKENKMNLQDNENCQHGIYEV